MKLHGLLLVDKTEGITSYDVIRKIKKFVPDQKIGHTGTLDPFATGLLLILFGEATKLSNFLSDVDKEYVATLKFGEETDTQDRTGRVVRTSTSPIPDAKALRGVLKEFEGRVRQRVPKYSAAKHQGRPFYELARRGEEVPDREREVEIHSIRIEEFRPPLATLRVVCGKGVYVRALASDIGDRVGTGAHLAALRRCRWGPYRVEDAIGADRITNAAAVMQRGIAAPDVLSFMPALDLAAGEVDMLRAGQPVKLFNNRGIVPAPNDGKIIMRVRNPEGLLSVVVEAERLTVDGVQTGAGTGEWLLKPLRVLQAQ